MNCAPPSMAVYIGTTGSLALVAACFAAGFVMIGVNDKTSAAKKIVIYLSVAFPVFLLCVLFGYLVYQGAWHDFDTCIFRLREQIGAPK